MPTELTMPKLSDTMSEGTILKWHIKEGDKVTRGEVIAEVETDKAAMEMEAYEDGVVLSIAVEEGETVEVGVVLAVIGDEGDRPGESQGSEGDDTGNELPEEEPSETEQDDEEPTETEQDDEEPTETEQDKAVQQKTGSDADDGERVAASPAARKLAREKGVDLASVKGSGPAGRIVVSDIERAGQARPKSRADAVASEDNRSGKEKKSVKIRRLIERKMVESWQTIPHFFVTVAVDMTDVIRFRKSLGVTINDFVLAATVAALKEHPWVNSHWVDGEAVEQEHINIAMATATERGLYNPIVKNCEALSLKQLSRLAADLADRAHHGKLKPGDLEDGTFTISNMGMLGVESFSAIVTPPQAAVLAVGTVKGEVVVDEHEELTVAPMVRLTLSADHRILDGADAAEFLDTLKSYLEAPVTLIAGTCFE